jgi:hypothetical protein
MLTLALITAGAETIGVIATYTDKHVQHGGQLAAVGVGYVDYLVPTGYGLTATVLVITATLAQAVRRPPTPSREPSWLSIGLSVGWLLLTAAGPFTISGGQTAQQFYAAAAAFALICLATGGYLGATSRWTSMPRLLAAAIPTVLVATTVDAIAGPTDHPGEQGFIVLACPLFIGVVCFLVAVGAALGGGVASLVPRRSRAADDRTLDQPSADLRIA